MTKMRVHELAKELGMENKELIDLLHKKNVEVSNHMSSIEDSMADEIRKERTAKAESKTAGEDAPKKKNLAFVIRPQNSKNSSRIQGKRPAQKPARPQQNTRPNEGKTAERQTAKETRLEKPSAVKPTAEKPAAVRPNTEAKTEKPAERQAAEKPQTVRQEKAAPVQNEKASDKERKSDNTRPVRENRDARPSSDRPVRENRENRGERQGRDGKSSERQGRFDRGSNDRPRQDRGQGGRSFGDGRQGQGRNDRDRRQSGQNGRQDREKRESRRDDVAASIVEQQKSQRNKAKDKERDNKKKEYRDEAFDGKGKKGKKQKQVAEVKRPQPKEEKKEEKIKQIVIPEVLTIKELADKMKIVPSVIVKKLFLQGKVVTVNQEIDYDTAEEIAMEFEVLCEKEEVVDVIEELLKEEDEDENLMTKRPTVVRLSLIHI